MRCARTVYEPAAMPGIRKCPDSSVLAPRFPPTMETVASGSGWLVPVTVTVPSIDPVACAITGDAAITTASPAAAERRAIHDRVIVMKFLRTEKRVQTYSLG